MNSKYNSKNHSKYKLQYHIILVCKYRKKLLTNGIDIELKKILTIISKKYDFEIIEMETDKDYIHLMVSASPKISPLQIVRVLKQQSTIILWQKFEYILRNIYWNKHIFWTRGYFVTSIGNVSEKTLRKYIQNQG